MPRNGLEHHLGHGGPEGADDAACLPPDGLAAALRLLSCLLDSQFETMRKVEAIVIKLLDVTGLAPQDRCAVTAEKVAELLTSQESRVLQQICLARTNRQIAKNLGITEKTAKNYVQAVFRKLCVHSRTEAALVAMRSRWFEGDIVFDDR